MTHNLKNELHINNQHYKLYNTNLKVTTHDTTQTTTPRQNQKIIDIKNFEPELQSMRVRFHIERTMVKI